jgi:hypothetical protein
MRKLFVLLSLITFAMPAYADDSDGFFEIEIHFRSTTAGYLQVRDNVCKLSSKNIECEKAAIKSNSEECGQSNPPSRCGEARELLNSSSCVRGLVFEGAVAREATVRVTVCKSSTGFGNLSVRDLNKGNTWTLFSLLNDGDSVSYQ